jgi:hypothetical protein
MKDQTLHVVIASWVRYSVLAIDFELRLQQLMVGETFADEVKGTPISEELKDDIAQHQLSVQGFGLEGKDARKLVWAQTGLAEQPMIPLGTF